MSAQKTNFAFERAHGMAVKKRIKFELKENRREEPH